MTIAYREYIINISYEYPTAANGFGAYSRNRNESRQYRWQLNPWFKLDGAAGLEPATSLLQSVPAEDEFARLTKSDGSGTRHWSARYGHTTRNANTPHLGRYLWECDRLEPLIDRNQADADLVCNTQGYLRDITLRRKRGRSPPRGASGSRPRDLGQTLSRALGACVQLALVLRGIEMSFRLRNQAVGAKPPLFEPADPDKFPGTAGTSVGSGQRPVVGNPCALHSEAIHLDHKIGKSGHESLHEAGNRRPAGGRGSVVDFEGSLICEE